MAGPVTYQLAGGLKRSSPYLMVILLVLLARLPLATDGFGVFMPFISLAFVYYWTVHSKEGVGTVVLMILGLLEDVASGAPLGFNPLVLIAVYALLGNQQRFFENRGFAAGWLGFGIVAFAALPLMLLLLSFYEGVAVSLWPLLISILSTIAVYPILGLVFGRLHKAALRSR